MIKVLSVISGAMTTLLAEISSSGSGPATPSGSKPSPPAEVEVESHHLHTSTRAWTAGQPLALIAIGALTLASGMEDSVVGPTATRATCTAPGTKRCVQPTLARVPSRFGLLCSTLSAPLSISYGRMRVL
jgi:hypothetical protein